jgi:hypothetical protein
VTLEGVVPSSVTRRGRARYLASFGHSRRPSTRSRSSVALLPVERDPRLSVPSGRHPFGLGSRRRPLSLCSWSTRRAPPESVHTSTSSDAARSAALRQNDEETAGETTMRSFVGVS